jgi:hypothetical protein
MDICPPDFQMEMKAKRQFENKWRASKVPAAAVIPSSLGNFEVDVVKKFVADFGHWPSCYASNGVMIKSLLHFAKKVHQKWWLLLAIAYHEENWVFMAVFWLKNLHGITEDDKRSVLWFKQAASGVKLGVFVMTKGSGMGLMVLRR